MTFACRSSRIADQARLDLRTLHALAAISCNFQKPHRARGERAEPAVASAPFQAGVRSARLAILDEIQPRTLLEELLVAL